MRLTLRFGALTVLLVLANSMLTRWSVGTVLSGAITAVALVLVRDGLRPRSPMRGIATMTLLYWGLSYVSNIIEALAFKVIPVAGAIESALAGLVLALVAAWLLERLTPPQANHSQPQSTFAAGAPWRIALLAFTFFVLYLAAGIAIQPWIMGFYAGRPLPSMQELAILVPSRGLFDIACIAPWFLQWHKSRRQAVWLSAYVFATLSGWAPLLLPNVYLPGPIRAAHAVEMGISGILFGVLAAFVLLRPVVSVQKAISVEGAPSPAMRLR